MTQDPAPTKAAAATGRGVGWGAGREGRGSAHAIFLDGAMADPFLSELGVIADAPAAPKDAVVRSTSSAKAPHVEAPS